MKANLLRDEQTIHLAPSASLQFNRWFWQELSGLAKEVKGILGEDLIAVVLGGSYGRDDGSVTSYKGHEWPCNDVDLFLITTTAFPRGMQDLRELGRAYKEELGIAVDFARPQTLRMVRKWPCTLLWQELALGHRVLYGPRDILLNHVPDRVFQPLPVVEASRLLLDRGAGLVWARRILEETDPCPDPAFVVRSYYRCAQAIADALLIAHGRYFYDPEERLQRILSLTPDHLILRETGAFWLLQSGIAFHHAPESAGTINLRSCEKLAIVWLKAFLWIESARLGENFQDAAEYAACPRRREEHEEGVWQCIAANLRHGRLHWENPREQLYRTLPPAIDAMARDNGMFPGAGAAALAAWRQSQ
ncbi:MAG: hypothetical protein LAP21_02885 [Acidobacteriia bacterium]|nr:hypothetical protein [Terriglobia bacterium]